MDPDDLAERGENEGLWDWNLATNRIHYSLRWISMLGCEESAVGNNPEEWFQRIHPEDLQQVRLGIQAHLAGSLPKFENQHRMLHKDGTYRWMSCQGLVVRDENGQPLRMAGSHSDITAGKVADALTGLPNRVLFLDRLARSINRGKRHSDFLFAVLLLDLDRFESLIERLGQTLSNQLLIAVARRLETCLRSADTVARLGRDHVVARLGEDQFTILLDSLNEVSEVRIVADRLLREISSPFKLAGQELFLTASIGIALSVTGYNQPEEALRDADIAMCRAKALGKARCEVFDTAILESAQTQLQLERDLPEALKRQEFSLFYQPIISLAADRIAGFEVLVRWNHPIRGLISPVEFIPLAEKSGFIVPLGWWILQEACRQLKAWQGTLGIPKEFWVSVNISSAQFKQPSFVAQVSEVLSSVGLEPHCLMLEMTESMAMENPGAVSSVLMQLRVLGVQIGLDDFGTGYSSLGYLRQFPLDYLKIDHTFVQRMGTSKDFEGIVRTIHELAQQLGLRVIAEGIENTEQLDLVQSIHCDFGQGWLSSPPVNSEKAEELLRDGLPQWQRVLEKGKVDKHAGQFGQSPPITVQSASTPLPSEQPRPERKAGTFVQKRWPLFAGTAAIIFLLFAGFIIRSQLISPLRLNSPNQVKIQQTKPAALPPVSGHAPQDVQQPSPHSLPPPLRLSSPNQVKIQQTKPAALPPVSGHAPQDVRQPSPHSLPPQEGGPAYKFPVIHQHVLGSCKGSLNISRDMVAFISEGGRDSFNFESKDYSWTLSKDHLTIKSGSKTYRFKPASTRNQKDSLSQLQIIGQSLSRSGKQPVAK